MKNNLFALLFLNSVNIFAQDILDTTFCHDGGCSTLIGNQSGSNSIAIQQDGKIVALGWTSLVNDTSHWFSSGNPETVPDSSDFSLVRYNGEDGTLDQTFGDNGIVITDMGDIKEQGKKIVILDNGAFLVGGESGHGLQNGLDSTYSNSIVLAKYQSNGSLDNTFGSNGVVTSTDSFGLKFNSFAVDNEGNIFVVGAKMEKTTNSYIRGYYPLIAKYKPFGVLDSSFGINGFLIDSEWKATFNSIHLFDDGKILVGGGSTDSLSNNSFRLRMYTSTGSPDSLFGGTGVVTTDIGQHDVIYDLLVSDEGKIIACGYAVVNSSKVFAVAKYNSDGSLDNSFGSGGKAKYTTVNGVAYAMAFHPNDKIIVIGQSGNYFRFWTMRILSNGQLDNTFSEDGSYLVNVGTYSKQNSIAIQSDNKIVVGGTSKNTTANLRYAVIRLNSTLSANTINDISDMESKLIVFPNPVSSLITLKYVLKSNECLSLELLDITGRNVKTFFTNEKRSAGENEETLKLGYEITEGVYTLKMTNAYGISFCQKIIKCN